MAEQIHFCNQKLASLPEKYSFVVVVVGCFNEKLASWPEILQIFDKTRFVAGKIQILMKTWLRGWKNYRFLTKTKKSLNILNIYENLCKSMKICENL